MFQEIPGGGSDCHAFPCPSSPGDNDAIIVKFRISTGRTAAYSVPTTDLRCAAALPSTRTSAPAATGCGWLPYRNLMDIGFPRTK